MMIKVNQEEVKYLVKAHIEHIGSCTNCDCYYSGLCGGKEETSEGCVEKYLQFLQME